MRKSIALVLASTVASGIPVVSQAADGKSVYEHTCQACHAAGKKTGAPKIGDKVEWKDRIAKGKAELVKNTLDGFQGYDGTMPARGGNPKLTDEEVKAAVIFLIENSK